MTGEALRRRRGRADHPALRALDASRRATLPLGIRVRRRLRSTWVRLRIWPVAIGVVAVVVLGWIGLGPVVQTDGLGWSERLWYTLLLFKVSAPAIPPHDPALAVAIWIAPLTTFYALFRALAKLYFEQWTRFRISRLTRHHVVVCGLGRCGIRFATAFARAGVPVLAIDCAPGPTEIELCREHGIALVAGDATDPIVLAQAGLHRADALIVVCGADAVNAQAGIAALGEIGTRAEPLECFVHIGDALLCAMLDREAFVDERRPSHVIEYFNIFHDAPRALLDAYGVGLSGDAVRRHLVVTGSGPIALSVVAEAARRRAIDPPEGGTLRITLVAPDAPDALALLRTSLPELESACTVTALALDASDDRSSVGLELDEQDGEVTTAFVCEEHDSAGVRSTIRLRRCLRPEALIVCCGLDISDSGSIVRLAGSSVLPNVEGCALLDRVCRPEVLLHGEREIIAQSIHAAYVQAELDRGVRRADDPSLVGWDALPEALRASNRDQARGIGEKLRAVGRVVVERTSWSPPGPVFSDEEVERLARLEHDRWMTERLAAGWRYGKVRDTAAKRHPSLVDWSALDDDDKDRDREAVRGLPLFLARAGYAIERNRAGAATTDAAGLPTEELPPDVAAAS